MNAITDLCSEAVSYLTLIQDILKSKQKEDVIAARRLSFWENRSVKLSLNDCDGYKGRIGELVWSSKGGEATADMVNWFFDVADGLLKWLNTYLSEVDKKDRTLELQQPPHFWREKIRKILYYRDGSRLELQVAIKEMTEK